MLRFVRNLTRILNAIDSGDPKAAVDDYLKHLAHEADALIMQDRAGRVAPITEFESEVNRDSGTRRAGHLDVSSDVGELSVITNGRGEESRGLRRR